MMLSHFHHRHLLLYCHVTSRIYTSLCRRKSNLDQSQLEVGVSVSPHLTAAVSAPHDVTRCPELQQKRARCSEARLQHLRVRAYRNIASPPSARSALQRHPALSAGVVHLHAGSAVFSVASCTFPVAIYYPRTSSQFLSVNLLSSADHWGHILFSAGERHRKPRVRTFPHITCY